MGDHQHISMAQTPGTNLARMDPENCHTRLGTRWREFYFTVDTPGSEKGGVEDICAG